MTGFHRLIKVEGRNFFNLSCQDAADMINAFLEGGNDRYDYSALPEFMLVPNKTFWLEELRLRLRGIDDNRRTTDEQDGLASVAGRGDLSALSLELRADGGCASIGA
jgi:hypothetical protein